MSALLIVILVQIHMLLAAANPIGEQPLARIAVEKTAYGITDQGFVKASPSVLGSTEVFSLLLCFLFLGWVNFSMGFMFCTESRCWLGDCRFWPSKPIQRRLDWCFFSLKFQVEFSSLKPNLCYISFMVKSVKGK